MLFRVIAVFLLSLGFFSYAQAPAGPEEKESALPAKAKEGVVEVLGHRIHFVIYGQAGRTPLLAVQGGPGLAHDCLLPLAALASERQVIFYDPLGTGQSDNPKDPSLWTLKHYLEELQGVREALHLDRFVLYGHSWGSSLALEMTLAQPQGLRAVVFAGPFFSTRTWLKDTGELLRQLPPEAQEAIARHERAGTTDNEEYRHASWEYFRRFMFRPAVIPEGMMKQGTWNREIYEVLQGRNEWLVTGRLKDYERVDALSEIRVPVLLLSGAYDEVRPRTMREYQGKIRGAKLVILPGRAHLALWEDPPTYTQVMRKYLQDIGE